jgi:hypothetical protein
MIMTKRVYSRNPVENMKVIVREMWVVVEFGFEEVEEVLRG